MYHYVHATGAGPALGYGHTEPERFREQLDAIGRSRTIVSWQAVAAALGGGVALPDDACLLTFDDGLDDHHRVVLPILAERRLPAVFFVMAREPSDGLTLPHRLHVLLGAIGTDGLRTELMARLSPDAAGRLESLVQRRFEAGLHDPREALRNVLQRELAADVQPVLAALIADELGPEDEIAGSLYLDRGQMNELRDAGMALGGHGRDHEWLDFVPAATVERELAASEAWLAGFGPGPRPFAYPFGAPPPRAGHALERHGFEAGYLAHAPERRAPGAPRADSDQDRFALGRVDAEDDAAFAGAIGGGLRPEPI
jgi:peptidoglycan/xylan/chitin deacetylase (PgdA/CDA1 family)